MSVRYLYNTAGDYVAFLEGENLFAPDGDWMGFLRSGNEVYSRDGSFLGYVLEDDRLARLRNEPRRPRVPRPPRPPRPLRPLRPLRRLRMARLQYPWQDLFEEGISGIAPTASTMSHSFDHLKGSSLVAADGKYLGKVIENRFDTESLANRFGPYGNQYETESIFNRYGTYGSRYSQLSPFNKYSRTPPHFERDGDLIAYLTANEFVRPRVEPLSFVAWLKR